MHLTRYIVARMHETGLKMDWKSLNEQDLIRLKINAPQNGLLTYKMGTIKQPARGDQSQYKNNMP